MSRAFQWRTEQYGTRVVSLDGKDLAQVYLNSAGDTYYVTSSLYHTQKTEPGEPGEQAVEADLNSILDFIERYKP